MATITKFEDLEIWQKARQLANDIFKAYTNSELFSRDYQLKDQINGSSGSIADNIAEGFERNGRNEFVQFLSIAKGSAGEVKSQLYRAFDRNYIAKEQFDSLYAEADELGKKIGGFISYLNKSDFKGTKFKREATTNSKS
jgi:four helix bundle protein